MRLRSQRPIFRALFLLCCVVPTLTIGAWSLQRLRPGYAQRYADELAVRLGLRVELAGLTHPRPGTSRLEGIRLIDPETGQPIASADRVTIVRGNRRMLVIMDGAAVQRDRLDRIWELTHDRILRQTDDMPFDSRVQCNQLLVRDAKDSVVLKGVTIDVEHVATDPKATWRFRLADTAEPIQVSVLRSQRSDNLLTRFELDTESTPLPCSLMRPFSEIFQSLGDQTVFQGHIWAEHSASGWDGELAGHLSGIDLAGLVGSTSTHQLTGLATAVVQSMRFKRSQVQSARGTVSAGPGTISGSFLNAAVRVLGLSSSTKSPPLPQTQLPYRQMDLGFVIESSGLSLYGLCPSDEGVGTVLVLADTQRTRIGQPAERSVPVVNLVRTLVPERQLLVPAARETLSLLRMLPLPPAMASRREIGTSRGVQ